MNGKTKLPENPDFVGMDAALKRAAKAAHELARKTKTPCYIWKDGQIVDINAKQSLPARSKRVSPR